MTTKWTKPVSREVGAYVREMGLRTLIVTINNGLLELRPKGLRSTETLDFSSLWQQAVKQRIAAAKALKTATRNARRKRS